MTSKSPIWYFKIMILLFNAARSALGGVAEMPMERYKPAAR